MAYDINQLLDNLPSLLMQHNRDQEAKRQFDITADEDARQFDVTTDKTEEERMRNYGINLGDFDIRKDQADRRKREQESMDMIGEARKTNLDRRKVHEDNLPDYLDKKRSESLLRFLPEFLSKNQKQKWTDEFWGEGAPERYNPNLSAYSPEVLGLQDMYNRPMGNTQDQMNLFRYMMDSQKRGGY